MTSARDEREQEPVTVRDKRRINLSAGHEAAAVPGQPEAVRPGEFPVAPAGVPDGSAAAEAADNSAVPGVPDVAQLQTQLGERTADLQRLKAEYDNYRRRVERDRTVSAEQAAGRVLFGLLPTLDDIARARQHGDVAGPFKAVADALETTLGMLGLERYGEPGEIFDPAIHEALAATTTPGVDAPTCVEVYRSGYRYAGRVLRPAQVVVAEPGGAQAPAGAADEAAAGVQSTAGVSGGEGAEGLG